jgi:hypothetical protein
LKIRSAASVKDGSIDGLETLPATDICADRNIDLIIFIRR